MPPAAPGVQWTDRRKGQPLRLVRWLLGMHIPIKHQERVKNAKGVRSQKDNVAKRPHLP